MQAAYKERTKPGSQLELTPCPLKGARLEPYPAA